MFVLKKEEIRDFKNFLNSDGIIYKNNAFKVYDKENNICYIYGNSNTNIFNFDAETISEIELIGCIIDEDKFYNHIIIDENHNSNIIIKKYNYSLTTETQAFIERIKEKADIKIHKNKYELLKKLSEKERDEILQQHKTSNMLPVCIYHMMTDEEYRYKMLNADIRYEIIVQNPIQKFINSVIETKSTKVPDDYIDKIADDEINKNIYYICETILWLICLKDQYKKAIREEDVPNSNQTK